MKDLKGQLDKMVVGETLNFTHMGRQLKFRCIQPADYTAIILQDRYETGQMNVDKVTKTHVSLYGSNVLGQLTKNKIKITNMEFGSW
jgi:hypothetical protein